MARDLVISDSKRDWSRGCKSRSSGEVVVCQSRGPGLLGWAVGLVLVTRVLTGKWPCHWLGKLDQRMRG
jgi:hypothetical protein